MSAQNRIAFNFGSGEVGIKREQNYRKAALTVKGAEQLWQAWMRDTLDREAERILKGMKNAKNEDQIRKAA